jgi:heme exporter protein D
VITQVCLVLLLFGNLAADYCLLADMGTVAARDLFPAGAAPGWLTAGQGRVVMLLSLLIIFPLSCLRRMRQVRGICNREQREQQQQQKQQQ